jgi:putative FmdB family regulatory protein
MRGIRHRAPNPQNRRMVYSKIRALPGGCPVPLYEYKCLKCNRRTEKIEPVNGPHLKKCPHCGGKVESLISAPAIQFKGSGWYVTDYAGKSPASESAKEEKSPSEKKDSKDSKDSSSKDSSSKDSSSKESKKEKPAKK